MAESSQITRLLPRHLEIMNRVMLGQKESDIANDLGMSLSRVSIIINSPLFQLELRKQLKKRQKRILDIEDTIIEASEEGAKLLKSTLSNPNIPLPIRVEVGNKALTHLFGRIIRQMPHVDSDEGKDGDELPYEKRLEREITVKETYYSPSPHNGGSGSGQNGSINEEWSDLPPDSLLSSDSDFDDEEEDEWEGIDEDLEKAIDSSYDDIKDDE